MNHQDLVNNFIYLMEPTGAQKASPKQILCVALQGTSIYIFSRAFFPFLGPWTFASWEVVLALGIFYTDVLLVSVWFSCLSHLQTLNIKPVNVKLGYMYRQSGGIYVCMYVLHYCFIIVVKHFVNVCFRRCYIKRLLWLLILHRQM